MTEKTYDVQDILGQFEFENDMSVECSQDVEKGFLERVKKNIKLILGEQSVSCAEENNAQQLISLIYKNVYCAFDNNKIYFFQLKYSGDRIKKCTLKNHMDVFVIEDNNQLEGNLRLHINAKADKTDETELRNFFAKNKYFVFDLEKKDKQIKFEGELFKDLARIKEATKQAGFFVIPRQVTDKLQLPAEKMKIINSKPKDLSEADTAGAKQVFAEKNYEYFLDKICELKIKEIAHYLANNDVAPPNSDVCLSVLICSDEANEKVTVVQAEVIFDKASYLAIGIRVKIDEGNLITCLMASRWNVNRSDKTILRFSNRLLEDIVEVQVMFGKVQYAVLTDKTDKRKGRNERNFWEELVFKRSLKDSGEQCKEFENDFMRAYAAEPEVPIKLTDDIGPYAKIDPERYVNQPEDIKRILLNQHVNHGTLLYLPTAYGKTFVVLLAIQEHFHQCKANSVGYLIVGPKSVANVWRKSAYQLYDDSNGKIDFRLIGFEGDEPSHEHDQLNGEKSTPILEFTSTEKLDSLIKSSLTIKEANIGDNLDIDYYYLLLGFLSAVKIIMKTDNKNYILFGTLKTWVEDLNNAKKQSNKVKEFLRVKCNYSEDWFSLEGFKTSKVKDVKLKEFIERASKLSGVDFLEFEFLSDTQKSYSKLTKDQKMSFLETVFYYISGSIYLEGQEINQQHSLIVQLSSLAQIRDNQLQELENYRQKFSGIVLDESDLVLKNSGESRTNKFLFGLAQHCQRRAANPQNSKAFLVAASATPWPNDISEFIDHVHFLLPGLIEKYHELLLHFARKWRGLERFLEQGKDNATDQFQKAAAPIKHHFFKWKKLFFEYLVAYCQQGGSSSNDYHEKLLVITCKDSLSVVAKKKDSSPTFTIISDFYSRCLGGGPEVIPDSDMLRKIFDLLSKDVFATKKIAFYIDRHEDARNLSEKIKKQCSDKIIFSYFFAVAIDTNSDEQQDRLRQLNAFNNIVVIGDLCAHILHKIKSNKKYEIDIAHLLRDYAKDKGASSNTKRKNKSKKKSIDKEYLKLFFKFAFDRNHELHKNVDNALSEFFLRLKALIDRSSNETIPNLTKEIDLLWQGISSYFKEEAPSPSVLVEKFNGFESKKVNNNHELFLSLIKFTLCYLVKISQSNILIFGPAGASGIRIDADILFILSGAWTEGRLSQIKGRVGRQKGKTGSSRPCQIYLPLTNTIFELFILKHYVRKSLLNKFLMTSTFKSVHLFPALFALHHLDDIYKVRIDKNFLFKDIHTLVEAVQDAEIYVSATPLEKANLIIKVVDKNYTQNMNALTDLLNSPPASPEPQQPEGIELLSRRLRASIQDDRPVAMETSSSAVMGEPNPLPVTYTEKRRQRRPEIIELEGEFLTDSYKSLVWRFVASLDRDEKLIILALPTRGVPPDLTATQFVQHLSNSISNHRHKFLVLLGINFEKPPQEEALSLAVKKLRTCVGQEYHSLDIALSYICKNNNKIKVLPVKTIEYINRGGLIDDIRQSYREKILCLFVPVEVAKDQWAVIIIDNGKKRAIIYLDPRGMGPNGEYHPKGVMDAIADFGYNVNTDPFKSKNAAGERNSQLFVLHVCCIVNRLILEKKSAALLEKSELKPLQSKFADKLEELKREAELIEYKALLDHLACEGINKDVLLIPQCFGWYSEDKKLDKNIPPLGRMRQYCIARAQLLYNFIKEAHPSTKMLYFSMDGDTGMTPESLSYLLETVGTCGDELRMVTAGYSLSGPVNFSALMSRISMNVYAQLGIPFYGYFSEPLFALSQALTCKVFDQPQGLENYERDEEAIYGFWDLEGRRFLRYCRRLIKEISIHGPSKVPSQRPTLYNIKRFLSSTTESIPFPITLQLSQQLLIEIITKMCGQSFNCINPYFMGGNISVFLQIEFARVRALAGYFYLKAFVKLLNLGPRRTHELIRAIYDHHVDGKDIKEKLNNEIWLSRYSVKESDANEKDMIRLFIIRIFVTDLIAPANGFEKFARFLLLWALHMSEQLMITFGEEYKDEKNQPMLHPEAYPKEACILAQEDSVCNDDDYENEIVENNPKENPKRPHQLTFEEIKAALDKSFNGWKALNLNPYHFMYAQGEKETRHFLIQTPDNHLSEEEINDKRIFFKSVCVIKITQNGLEVIGSIKEDEAVIEELKSMQLMCGKKQKTEAKGLSLLNVGVDAGRPKNVLTEKQQSASSREELSTTKKRHADQLYDTKEKEINLSPAKIMGHVGVFSSLSPQSLSSDKLSTASKLDILPWYSDDDISVCVRLKINQIGGFKKDHQFLLSGIGDGKFPDEDGNRYFVLVTGAVDTQEMSLPINYFLDKAKQPRNSLAMLLEPLIPHLEYLKARHIDEDIFKIILNKLIGDVISVNDRDDTLGKIRKELIELKFSKDDVLNRIKELEHRDKKDIFDEIAEMIRQQDDVHIKILTPYNLTQKHWLTMEIKIHKKDKQYYVELTAHDPYGGGKLLEDNYQLLSQTLEQQIHTIDSQAQITFENVESAYSLRQDRHDGNACGVVVVEDIHKRISGSGLQQPKPYPIGAYELRSVHIQLIEKYLPEKDEMRLRFIKRHGGVCKEASNLQSPVESNQRHRFKIVRNSSGRLSIQ